ncbi:unnamed protein product [Rodentolepis nana]|uniref:Glutathione transferase n=1 Tax=Rodentolepis nana TaxID=102285 RepID=A0A158QH11_RODNA|nr:unnamed protein product [Rodentolepis nana]
MYHLGQGDPEPDINPDKFTLYDFKFCPFCQRVRYTLDYHKIPYDRVLINLINKPDWYLRLHPSGKTPFLRYRGEKLAESDMIIRFVDQFKGDPETSLLSICGEDAFKNALSLSMAFTQPRFKIVYLDPSVSDVDDLLDACSKIDAAVVGPYFCGDKLSLADMALAPFLNGWECVLQRIASLTSDVTGASIASSYPKFTAYRELMEEQPFAKATGFTADEYAKFVEIYRNKDISARY